MKVALFVHGVPAPGGSKKAFPFWRDGKVRVAVTDAGGKRNKTWKRCVGTAAHAQGHKLEGPLAAYFTFFIKRPKSHFKKGVIRDKAPHYPAVRPDVTKLIRSTEDALTGIIYNDDAQIVIQNATKMYTDHDDSQGCSIEIMELEPRQV